METIIEAFDVSLHGARVDCDLAGMQDLLAADERARLERTFHDIDRRRFLLGRAMARTFAGRIAGLAPHRCTIITGDNGQPRLDHEGAPFFSISHAGDWVVVAVRKNGAVGVDLEPADRDVDFETIARFLGARDQTLIHAVAPDRRALRALALWTRKEACGKALGQGLRVDPDTIEPVAEADRPLAVVAQTEEGRPADLFVWSPRLLEGHILSIAWVA